MVSHTGTGECTFKVKIVGRHGPAEPQHMKNGLVQRLVHVGLSFLLFHVLSSDSIHFSELVSDRRLESASCEKNGGVVHHNTRCGRRARRFRGDGTERVIRSRMTVP